MPYYFFYFNLRIYRSTTGGSYAYRCWAIATFFIFMASFVALIGSLVAGDDYLASSNSNEIIQLFSFSFSTIGYFYLPIGILYISSELHTYDLDQKKIKMTEIGYLLFILSSFCTFFVLLFEFYVVNIFGPMFYAIETIIWTITLFVYYPFYKEIKNINKTWSYLFFGIICALTQSVLTHFKDIGFEIFGYFRTLFIALLGIFFIFGFYKLAKMVEAV